MYKINRFFIYSVLFLALFIHLTILNYIKIFGAKPDLLLISVVFFGLFLGRKAGFESGFAAGLLKDLLSLDVFWINTFTLSVAGFLAGVLNTKFFKESKMTQTLLVFFLTTFSMLIHFLIVTFFSKSIKISLLDHLFSSTIPTSIYTALISIPIFSKLIDLYGLKEEYEDLL